MSNSMVEANSQQNGNLPAYSGILGTLVFILFFIPLRSILLKIEVYMLTVEYSIYYNLYGIDVEYEFTIDIFFILIYSILIGLLLLLATFSEYIFVSKDIRTVVYLKKIHIRNGAIISIFMILFYLIKIPNNMLFDIFEVNFFDWFLLLMLALAIAMSIGIFSSIYLVKKLNPKFFEMRDNERIKQINHKINEVIDNLISKKNEKKEILID